MRYISSIGLPILFSVVVQETVAKSIPANVAALKAAITSSKKCDKPLKTGFYATDDGPNTWDYCGDHMDEGIMYISGANGALVNMDVDCDGLQNGPGDDGRCGSSGDTQSQTSWDDTVAGYKKGVGKLNAYVHPYVVFGNVCDGKCESGYTVYDPTKAGVEPLSLMVVVCNNQMFYGIYGDQNGDDGPKAVVGEASISMATLCFGKDKINGNSGHDQDDVLVLAFTGKGAVPGADGADWGAKSVDDFLAFSAFDQLGDKLVAQIGGGSAGATNETESEPASGSAATPTTLIKSTKPAKATGAASSDEVASTSCSWTGHCTGAACSSDSACSGELVCTASKCASG